MIHTVALVALHEGRVLMVRPRGMAAFYLPGGKLERGEAPAEALRRELGEELGTHVEGGTLERYGIFENLAYGQPEGTEVRITCFLGRLAGTPAPGAEVEELRYFDRREYEAQAATAPAVRGILRDLAERGLLD